MKREPVLFAACSDISGQVRGKAFPLVERDSRLKKGVGWVPTNIQITCFNSIADSPFGSTGDLLLIPDISTEVCIDFGEEKSAQRFVLSDICTLDGDPWEFCVRHLCKLALDDLLKEAGFQVKVAFEHEFWKSCSDNESWIGFGLGSFSEHREFLENVSGAIRAAGLKPDTVLAEYGSSQFEVTVAPSIGLRAADECILLREAVRAVARNMNENISFSPVIEEGIGNGLHIHISLTDEDESPATHDPNGDLGMTAKAGSFFAGVRKYMPAIVALTAPRVISGERLVPHRWSAAFNNIAIEDREAALRVCPVVRIAGSDPQKQFNVEYRAADATASPYIQLAAIVRAGLQGIRDNLQTPEPTEGDLSTFDSSELEGLDIQPLPTSLSAALGLLHGERHVSEWFGEAFIDLYTRHKSAEIQFLQDKDNEEIRRLYRQIY